MCNKVARSLSNDLCKQTAVRDCNHVIEWNRKIESFLGANLCLVSAAEHKNLSVSSHESVGWSLGISSKRTKPHHPRADEMRVLLRNSSKNEWLVKLIWILSNFCHELLMGRIRCCCSLFFVMNFETAARQFQVSSSCLFKVYNRVSLMSPPPFFFKFSPSVMASHLTSASREKIVFSALAQLQRGFFVFTQSIHISLLLSPNEKRMNNNWPHYDTLHTC